MFFALYGSRRDGHAFIPELYQRGVRNFIVYGEFETKPYPDANFVLVEDSLNALQQLAAYHRQQFDIPVIGITGSNGKTIVKEWLNQLLEDRFQIVRSPRSYNSQIGVPLSIWQMNSRHELALIEAGISQSGEMQKLQNIIQPTIGVLTNIGEAHDQGFTSTGQKLLEKLQLFSSALTLIYHTDQVEVKKTVGDWHNHNKQVRLVSIGGEDDCDVQIQTIKKNAGDQTLTISYEEKTIQLKIGFEDEAALENAITCIAVMLYLRIPLDELQKGLDRLSPLALRMELKTGINHSSVINDSYSADISSLKMALDFLSQQKQHTKRTLILSDILESRRAPAALYKEVTRLLQKYPVDRLIAVGKQLEEHKEILEDSGVPEKIYLPSTENLLSVFPTLVFRDETILLKGARIFGFERIDQMLSRQVHETILEVNLESMAHNLHEYKKILRPTTKIMAMVKAFSYGTGGFEIARLLEFHKVDFLAVAYADEGVALRKDGIRLPIVVMNTEEHGLMPLLEYQLEPVLYSLKGLRAIEKLLNQEGMHHFPVHIELETGMNRLGFSVDEIPELTKIVNSELFRVQSVFSHLAASEEEQQDDYTRLQFDRFQAMSLAIQEVLGYRFIRHISNSAGLVRNPFLELDMVRLGIGLYGVDPAVSSKLDLKEVGTLKTTIAQIKFLKAGETIGYNRRGIAGQPTKIGTLRLGYADGYARSLGNGVGKIWYRGKLVPTIGSVSMDMVMIDLTGISEAKEGDEVIIFGSELSVKTVAHWAGTIPYEILAGVSQRVKRVYFE